jgi:hypothetical protein
MWRRPRGTTSAREFRKSSSWENCRVVSEVWDIGIGLSDKGGRSRNTRSNPPRITYKTDTSVVNFSQWCRNWVSLPSAGTEGRGTGNCSSPKGGVSNIQGGNNLFTRPRILGTFITSFLRGFLRTRSLGNKHFPPVVKTRWGRKWNRSW